MWILLFLSGFLIALLLARRGCEWRTALLSAAILWGVLLTTFTELLGSFDLLTKGGLAACWAAVVAIALLLNFRLKKPRDVFNRPTPLSTTEFFFLGGVALILLATFITAILFPPNTWDSMTYHMPRVMHWLQNRSIDHYPTHILRQIEMNPWAEFAILHFQSLSEGDRFANLVQWFSMVGSLLGVSLIAKQLGGDRKVQLLAAIMAATIPMGILQSTSTQNDYVVAFWLVCLAWAGIQFLLREEMKWAALAGLSLGLAVLTKGTSYLYALPFIAWFSVVNFRGSPRKISVLALCFVVPLFLLNLPHYQRNLTVFSNPLTSGQHSYANHSLSAGTLFSNTLRNSALQFSTPISTLNQLIEDGVRQAHKAFNLDPDDRKTTWIDENFKVPILSPSEDSSGNILHVALTLAALLTLLASATRQKENSLIFRYTAVLATGFLLFCLVLKWQPWHSRLLLSLFVLMTPAVGVIVSNRWNPRWVSTSAVVLLIAALPWVFCNSSRPLIMRVASINDIVVFPLLKYDRNQLYFLNRPELYEQYVQMAEDIKRGIAVNIGLVTSEDSWEYPLWVLIKNGYSTSIRIAHVDVDNASHFIQQQPFQPDYLVKIN